MKTKSELMVAEINTNIFYKEFTFDKNEFCINKGQTKELADNIVLLDDLFFIIQIKERNVNDIKTSMEEDKRFANIVIWKGKKQIKDSIRFFNEYASIPITNRRQHTINVSKHNIKNAKKIIIYHPNSELLSEKNRFTKFYESRIVENIHIIHLEDYLRICKFLLTPTELNEYLEFRENLYLDHKNIIKNFPEQYILAHFLNTPDFSHIDVSYIDSLKEFSLDGSSYDISNLLNNFYENMYEEDKKKSTDYYEIIKVLAKLPREEIIEFKKRYKIIIDSIIANKEIYPYRFTSTSSQIGFVFIGLLNDKIPYWQNALINYTSIYKYKRKLQKCIGVVIYKIKKHWHLNWILIDQIWIHDEVMEEQMKIDEEIYGTGKVIYKDRYMKS